MESAPQDEPRAGEQDAAVKRHVRRLVGAEALRRIHRALDERRREERLLRARVVPVAAVIALAIAALIWVANSTGWLRALFG